MKRSNRRRGSKRTEKKKDTLPYLSHELIVQILERLPVKSLIRFKYVCQSWFSLISDPYFANSHFQITTATHTRRILCIRPFSDCQTRSIDLTAESLDDDFACDSLNVDFLLLEYRSYFEIKGSCRGFVLLHHYSNLYLWNPSTGFHRKVPLSPNGSKLHAEYFYGFGYDRLTDDYLVVLMTYGYDPTLDDNYSCLEFFSSIDNVWKEIECSHNPHMSTFDDKPKAGCLYNGAIHWLAFHRDIVPWRDNVIVAFDFNERKLLEEMPPPDDFEHDDGDCGLWVFGEFFSLWSTDYVNKRFEIWVMKEYKVNSSWTKTLVFPIDRIPTRYFYPLCCTKSGDIIGTNGGIEIGEV
jgi:F-box interacting protein